jgi:hypothetical protein
MRKRGCQGSYGAGRLAQLGERCLRKAEVGSSSLLPSIQALPDPDGFLDTGD